MRGVSAKTPDNVQFYTPVYDMVGCFRPQKEPRTGGMVGSRTAHIGVVTRVIRLCFVQSTRASFVYCGSGNPARVTFATHRLASQNISVPSQNPPRIFDWLFIPNISLDINDGPGLAALHHRSN
jgi:hypothetical protein